MKSFLCPGRKVSRQGSAQDQTRLDLREQLMDLNPNGIFQELAPEHRLTIVIIIIVIIIIIISSSSSSSSSSTILHILRTLGGTTTPLTQKC